MKTRRGALDGQLTVTSAFLLTLQLEWALTIFLTVARGYIFCPGAISLSCRVVEGRIRQRRLFGDQGESVASMLLPYAVRGLVVDFRLLPCTALPALQSAATIQFGGPCQSRPDVIPLAWTVSRPNPLSSHTVPAHGGSNDSNKSSGSSLESF